MTWPLEVRAAQMRCRYAGARQRKLWSRLRWLVNHGRLTPGAARHERERFWKELRTDLALIKSANAQRRSSR